MTEIKEHILVKLQEIKTELARVYQRESIDNVGRYKIIKKVHKQAEQLIKSLELINLINKIKEGENIDT